MFLQRVLELIDDKGITRNKFLIELNLSKNSFVAWENRGTIPSGGIVAKIADYFNVSTDYLLGRTDEKVQPPTDEKLDRNVILILGRDGSRHEYEVSDSLKELVKQALDNLNPVENERV